MLVVEFYDQVWTCVWKNASNWKTRGGNEYKRIYKYIHNEDLELVEIGNCSNV